MSSEQDAELAEFGQIVERYHNLICAIAYSRTGDRVASEDIAQETFLVAWKGASRLRDPSKVRAWLCGIARNLSNKTMRARRREVIEEIDHAGGESPLDQLITQQDEAAVWGALQQLPPTYREPLILFYREDQSIKRVADGLGLSEETAKQRLSRGRAALKQNVELVERTVASGRPRKAAVAAVLAALVLVPRRGAAASAATSKWKDAGIAGACVAAGVAVVVGISAARSTQSTHGSHDREVLAQLRDARATRGGGARTCETRGSVRRRDGSAVPGVLVAMIEHSMQATALEPTFVPTDSHGAWRISLPAGGYTLAVSAAGYRAQTRAVTCGGEYTILLDAGGALVHGSIADVGGGGVAEATVWLTDPQTPASMFVTRSDAAGAYDLRVPPGSYMVLTRHPEYTFAVRPVSLGDSPVREDFTLLPGASIEGTVVDGSGAPVPGASVSRVPVPLSTGAPVEWQLASAYSALLPVVTDANGRFTLRGQTPGELALSARSSTSVTTQPTRVELALAEAKTGVTVTVEKARPLTGFVVAREDEHRGLANVQVMALRDGALATLPIVATTDGAGYFELPGLAPGTYRIAALGSGYAPYVSEEQVSGGGEMLVRLERGAVLRGRAEPGSVVRLQPTKTLNQLDWIRAGLTRAEVDERGDFEFAAVAPGDYVLAATTYDRRGELPVHVDKRDQRSLNVTLVPRPAISGQVVDDTGKPLAGALVTAQLTEFQDAFNLVRPGARTDERGAFKIVGVAPGSHRVRVFDANGQRPWASEKRPFKAREVEAPAAEKLVVASRGMRVTGLVVGPDRRPVEDAWVEIRSREAEPYPALYQRAPILTDAAGRFAIDGVFGSELVVEATASNGKLRAEAALAPGAQARLELQPLSAVIVEVSERADVVLRQRDTDQLAMQRNVSGEVRLTAIPGPYELEVTAKGGYLKRAITIAPTETRVDVALVPWASVRGRVVGADGKPWADAKVMQVQSLVPESASTDSDGRFALERVVAGPNELMVRKDGDFVSLEINVAPGQQLDLEDIEERSAGDDLQSTVRSLRPQTTASASADLGLRFFVAVEPPTDAEIAAVARDPLLAYRGKKDLRAALWIAGVDAGGVAARAGLRRGDRVLKVGMSTVGTGPSAAYSMMSLSQKWRSRGRAVRWVVARDGREVAVDVLVPD